MTHAVLLVGETAFAEARKRAAELLGDHQEYLKIITPFEGRVIRAKEDVREDLLPFFSLKVPGKAELRRVAIIQEADKMLPAAQNILLKTLEEPPVDTVIFLTTAYPESLLPTIRSRTQIEHLKSPTEAPETEVVQLVKQVLAASPNQRLLMIDKELKPKDTASQFTNVLATIADATLKTSPQINRWHKILTAAHGATEALSKNANQKLVLTELMLTL